MALASVTSSPATSPAAAGSGSATKEQAASQGLNQTFDSFLKLLTTQLSNQDPLAPLDPTQFTTQLAQFSEVEQAISTNKKLQSLIDAQSAGQTASAVSYLGKIIEAQGDKATLANGTAQWSYNLAANATAVTVAILDSHGQAVRLLPGPTGQGSHQVVWDGRDDAGNSLPDGVYQIQVAARDQAGNPVGVTTSFSGPVTGVSFTGGQIMLETAGSSVALTNVSSVRDPNASTTSAN
jgi:flagellar basal-body rod modification protein FlgD